MPQERIAQETVDAAQEIRNFLLSKLQTKEGVHIGTLVASAARLSGTTMMRSFNLQLNGVKPGTVVLSEQANEEWPTLMGLVFSLLKSNGVAVKDNEMVINAPKEHAPRKELLQTQSELQGGYRQITTKFRLNDNQAAYAGAIACAMFIQETQKVVDPHISCGIAAFSFVESTKTVPIPFASPE